MTWLQFLLINIGAAISALGTFFLKSFSSSIQNANSVWQILSKALTSPSVWLGGLCYVIPIFFWTYLLRSMDVTRLQPLLAVVYIYTAGIAFFFLNERPSALRIIGTLIVMIGVAVVGFAK